MDFLWKMWVILRQRSLRYQILKIVWRIENIQSNIPIYLDSFQAIVLGHGEESSPT